MTGRRTPSRRGSARSRIVLGVLLGFASVSASACKVSEHDIDTWKGTRKGPGKMVAVVLADKFDPRLRSHAALELVEMERQDVDGVAEMHHAIRKLDPGSRSQIIGDVADGLVALMNKPAQTNTSAAQASDARSATVPHQVRAKDAAFLLAADAPPEVRDKLIRAVVGWYTADFNDRSLAGNFSAEQVMRGLGAAAASQLIDALNAQLPQAALIKLAELIGQLGDAPARKRAGERLVQIQRDMEGPAFLAWLKGQISAQMKQAGSTPDAARVAKAAELNRENFISNGAIPALKYLADQPEVSRRLLEIASTKDPALTERRTRALQALEGKLGPDQLDEVLALALDPANPVAVRDYAFDRVGDIRSPKALASMWPLLQSEDERLRWRAGELILAIGGVSVLNEFFDKLPAGPNVTYEPEELDGYAQRMAQMTPAPHQYALAQLQSPNWWDNVIALDYFQRKGSEADIAQMEPLKSNSTQLHGKRWEKTDTVGTVAERAIAGLRERLKDNAGVSAGASVH